MLNNDPLWYKDAIIYELHVRSFFDSVGDGMGDFGGLSQKLDYLQDLGVNAIWLLPFYPSPLRDDGYDTSDYQDVHAHYGKISDFETFLNNAHRRGLRVITELVVNHTSDKHPWFQRARRSPPGSPERDFYVWSDTPNKYNDARIIFKDFERSNWTWDPVAKAYYWHRFFSHQPDLNYDNPAVRDAILPVVDFWLAKGVDGMRLDAVPYLFEREGTSCENLPETHEFLKTLRRHVDENFPNRMLLAEANQWPEDAVAYFGNGDESNMAFHFPLMPRMFMAIHMEDRLPIIDILAQTPAIPETCQWCLFLRNHDELTLEMVTDEERDYMYRAYVRDQQARINLGIRHRLAPLLGNSRRRIELMNGLLFSLPGTPVIYYGDEIGMGDNIYLGDRNGVRTPMQWSGDRNAGFSRANPQKLFLPVVIDPEYHYEAVNVESQQNNPNSLLWWMKRLIALRKRHQAFSRGTLRFLHPANRKVLAFLRTNENERILVVANLSRFVQHVELDLAESQGVAPVELFGRHSFPVAGRAPYPLTLGPHAFYWFSLGNAAAPPISLTEESEESRVARIVSAGPWEEVFRSPAKQQLELHFPAHLQRCGWLGEKGRWIKSVSIRESLRCTVEEPAVFACFLDVEFTEGRQEMLTAFVAFAQKEKAGVMVENHPAALIARLDGESEGVLFDALADDACCQALLRTLQARRAVPAGTGELVALTIGPPNADSGASATRLTSRPARAEQANVSIFYGDALVLKVFRRYEEGIHPEIEVGRYLTENGTFTRAATILGGLEYRRRKMEPVTLASLHAFVPNEGTAWQYFLDEISHFFERVLALTSSEKSDVQPPKRLLPLGESRPNARTEELLGRSLESAQLLGQRTGELHMALGRDTNDPAFAPEAFTVHYQRSAYQSMRNVLRLAVDQLGHRLDELPDGLRKQGQMVFALESTILDRFHLLLQTKLGGQRIRCHGDYNLCEILFTGRDLVVIDFEGDRNRSLNDRRIKRSPLRDVASMIRSLQYAAFSPLHGEGSKRGRAPGLIRTEDIAALEPWAWTWYYWVASGFLKAYFDTLSSTALLPPTSREIEILLDAFLLEKSLQEITHELEHRPHWLGIPLQGLMQILGNGEWVAITGDK